MEKVGFIGLGRMGRPMASNLCRKGFRLTVNDINPRGRRRARTAAGERRSDGRGSRPEVGHHRHHAAELGRRRGCHRPCRWRHRQCKAGLADPGHEHDRSRHHRPDRQSRGGERAGFVDAPVGRLASHADRGESLFMVGGSVTDFERVKPLLEAMGNYDYPLRRGRQRHPDQAGEQLPGGRRPAR